jgi:chemotaxis protein MotB
MPVAVCYYYLLLIIIKNYFNMKTRITAAFTAAGLSVLLLTSCVSSKKYKASQAALQQVRNDSAQLAQQVSSLNQNVSNMEQQNKGLRQSLDSTTGLYTTQQKSLDYYQTYYSGLQTNLQQVSQELKDALAQAGVSEQDMQQTDGAIYISLDEDSIFKRNSTTVSATGKQILTGIADVIRKHDDVVVNVDNGVDATASMAAADQGGMSTSTSSSGMSSSTGSTARKPRKTTSSSMSSGSSSGSGASASTASNNSNVVKKKATRKYSTESKNGVIRNSGVAYSKKSTAAWTKKTGRVNAVAKGLIQNGVPKVHVATQQQPAAFDEATDSKKIKVIVRPKLKDFNPPAKATAAN